MLLDLLDEKSEKLPVLPLDCSTDQYQPPSSTASSEPPSPNISSNLILSQHESTSQTNTLESSTSTHTTASTSSLPAPTLNVKFAPLPELAPRKRRSTAPLGMAARGALARKRRGLPEMTADGPPVVVTYASPRELELERLKQEEMAARYAQYQASAAAQAAREYEAEQYEEELESEKAKLTAGSEPRSLGKIVKVARRSFWRRGANKDDDRGNHASAETKDTDKTKKRGSTELRRRKSDPGRDSTSLRIPSQPVPPLPETSLRPILATIPSNTAEFPVERDEDAVWREGTNEGILHDVSQTETFVEGRPRTSSSLMKTTDSKVDELAKSLISKMEGKAPSLLRPPNSRPPLTKSKSAVDVKS